jgi:hypothetical protein
MRVIILLILLLSICVTASAKDYYLYLANRTDNGNDKGDIIDVLDATIVTPSDADYRNFDVILVTLVDDFNVEGLKEPLYQDGDPMKDIIKSRKYKINEIDLKKVKYEKKDDKFVPVISNAISIIDKSVK